MRVTPEFTMNGTILLEGTRRKAIAMSRLSAHVIPEEVRVRHREERVKLDTKMCAKHRSYSGTPRADKVLAKWSRKQSALIAQQRMECAALSR